MCAEGVWGIVWRGILRDQRGEGKWKWRKLHYADLN
jgi:hypothetical protein